jgi:hypothetical protein
MAALALIVVLTNEDGQARCLETMIQQNLRCLAGNFLFWNSIRAFNYWRRGLHGGLHEQLPSLNTGVRNGIRSGEPERDEPVLIPERTQQSRCITSVMHPDYRNYCCVLRILSKG